MHRLRKRVEAEHGYNPSNGVIHRYGNGIKNKKKKRTYTRRIHKDNAVDYIEELQRKARLFDKITSIIKGA